MYGYDTTVMRPREVVRAVGATDDRAGAVATDADWVPCLEHREGAAWYPAWLHETRYETAKHRKLDRDRKAKARPRPGPPRCVVCGTPWPGHGPTSRELSRMACRECRPALDVALGE